MNGLIEKYETNLTRLDMSWTVRRQARKVRVLHHFAAEITKWHERFPDRELDVNENSIEITSPDRASGELGWFLQCFGGSPFTKKPNAHDCGIDYTRQVDCPFGGHYPFTFRASCVTPPPSCRIEEYEEDVPATRVKRSRIVCKEGTENDPEPLPPEPEPNVNASETSEEQI